MEQTEVLEKVLHSFKQYYDIKTTDVNPPFVAEAEFHLHNEQYFLVKSAKIADMDCNEYVFFALESSLSSDKLGELALKAWNYGLGRVKICEGHKSSDVTLIILANQMDKESIKAVKKTKYSKSYKFGLLGYSNFKLIVYDSTLNKVFSNRLGKDTSKNISRIMEL